MSLSKQDLLANSRVFALKHAGKKIAFYRNYISGLTETNIGFIIGYNENELVVICEEDGKEIKNFPSDLTVYVLNSNDSLNLNKIVSKINQNKIRLLYIPMSQIIEFVDDYKYKEPEILI